MSLNGGGNLGLGITLSSDASSAVKGFQQLETSIKGATKTTADMVLQTKALQEVGRGIWGAGSAGMGSMFGLAKATGAFEQQVARVGLVSQASAADLMSLRQAAMSMGIAGLSAPTEAAKALESLASQGLNAKESISALRPALDMAVGGAISAESSAAALTSALKVFSLDASEAASVADRLLAISNATALAPKDLENALGTVGRGASIAKQSLNEMLPAMGLVRNTGVDASVAASSVSSALLHMAEVSKKFTAIGVHVTDAKGQFRPFLDIVMETQAVLDKKYPDAAKKAAAANDLFSKFGLTAYSGITAQLTKGITDETGKMYKGAEAVKYLRQSMENATGTAAKFSSTMLEKDPFGRLGKILESMKIEVGRGFLAIFGPAVSKIADAVAKLTTWFGALSEPMRKTISAVLIGITAFVGMTGAILLTVAAFKLLLLGAGTSLAGVMVALTPVLLGMGALALILSGGSLSGGFSDIGKKAGLAFNAIGMLFSRGGFTKKMWDDLNQGGNEGVRDFAINVYHWGGIIKNFITGLWDGFVTRLQLARPTFERLGEAFDKIGRALGFGVKESTDAAGKSLDEFGAKGSKVGGALGTLAEFAAGGLAMALEGLSGLIEQMRKDWPEFKKAIDGGAKSLSEIVVTINDVRNALGITNGDVKNSSSTFESWGGIVGWVIGRVVQGLNKMRDAFGAGFGIVRGLVVGFIGVVESLWDVLAGFLSFFQSDFNMTWTDTWHSLARILYGVVGAIFKALATLVEGSAGAIDAMGKMMGKNWGLAGGARSWKTDTMAKFAADLGITGETGWNAGLTDTSGDARRRALRPPAEGGMSMPEGGMSLPMPVPVSYSGGALESSPETNAALARIEKAISVQPPINVMATVDGEVLFRATKRQGKADATASFDPGVSFSSGE